MPIDSTVPKKSRPRPPGGSRKGIPNKTTVAMKDALQQAFDQLGGVPALVRFGQSQPADFYKLWIKMLPQDVTLTGKVVTSVSDKPLSEEQWEQQHSQNLA